MFITFGVAGLARCFSVARTFSSDQTSSIKAGTSAPPPADTQNTRQKRNTHIQETPNQEEHLRKQKIRRAGANNTKPWQIQEREGLLRQALVLYIERCKIDHSVHLESRASENRTSTRLSERKGKSRTFRCKILFASPRRPEKKPHTQGKLLARKEGERRAAVSIQIPFRSATDGQITHGPCVSVRPHHLIDPQEANVLSQNYNNQGTPAKAKGRKVCTHSRHVPDCHHRPENKLVFGIAATKAVSRQDAS